MESGALESLLEVFLCRRDTEEGIGVLSGGNTTQYNNISLFNTNNAQLLENRYCNISLRNLTNHIQNDLFKDVIIKLNIYATPFLILVGVLGNLLSFLVFTTTHLRRQSSSVYLASLALVDALFLLVLTIVWLNWIQIPLINRKGWCQLTIYLTYVTNFLSAYLVVAFTVERYILVSHPFKRDKFCTTTRAFKVASGLFIISIIVYSISTWTNGVQNLSVVDVCMPLPQYYTLLTVFTMFDFVVTLIVPSVIIVTLNIRIAYQIISLSKERESLEQVTVLHTRLRSDGSNSKDHAAHIRGTESNQFRCLAQKDLTTTRVLSTDHDKFSTTKSLTHRSMRISQRRMRAQHRTARMLLVVSSVFVVLHLPGHASKIYAFIESSRQDVYATERHTLRWQEVFPLLYHLNFAINFLLYSLSGSTFRKALKMLCCRILHWIQNHL